MMIFFLSDRGFHISFGLVIVWGTVLTFSQFLCAAVCSALTASLVNVAKSALQTSIGFVTFGGVPLNPLNLLGESSRFESKSPLSPFLFFQDYS